MSKFDKLLNILSKIEGGCFLCWIKIADTMSEKTADIKTKTPPSQFSVLINDLVETFNSSVLTEQMVVFCGTYCL